MLTVSCGCFLMKHQGKDVAKVRRLITRSKVCVNSKAHEMGGWTALVAAARDGLVNIVKFLHQANADIDATNDDGQTAMILAAEGGHLATVRYLVEVAEANVDVVDNYGDTALIYASRIDRFEVVRYLVEEVITQHNTTQYNDSTKAHTSIHIQREHPYTSREKNTCLSDCQSVIPSPPPKKLHVYKFL
eukprot:1360479-Amorphochlora_amoeboformis.AAC.1